MFVQRIRINLGEMVRYKEKESILYIDRCMVLFVLSVCVFLTHLFYVFYGIEAHRVSRL